MSDIYNKDGLRALKTKADAFRDSKKVDMKIIPTFYRNKPSAYFNEISEKYNNVMHPYLKDANGDRYCPINKRVKGLFYMGRRDKKDPSSLPSYFMFGNKRVIVPVHLILNWESRLYFCDFWCHRSEHYVTVVVTKQGTEADTFCQEHLLELNKSNNSYLELKGDSVSINQNIWVEVFSTEKLDLKDDGITWDTGFGGRVSRPNGMPKKCTCSTCNLSDKSNYVKDGPPEKTEIMSENRVPVLPEFMTPIPPPETESGASVNVAPLEPVEASGSLNILFRPVEASGLLKRRRPSDDDNSSESVEASDLLERGTLSENGNSEESEPQNKKMKPSSDTDDSQ